MQKKLFLLLQAVLFSSYLLAQTTVLAEEITIEDGLSQGFVGVMHQDREGFLWLGTKNGLNRYDGERFELFTHDINDDYSISNDWIRSIHEKGDFLLIACKSRSLNLFHKKTKQFYRVSLEIEELSTFNDINQILEDEQGDFWLEIRFKNKPSLLRLSFPERFWQAFPSDTSLLSSVETKFIDRIDDLHVYDHNFFIYYEGQLTQLDFKTSTHQAVPSNFSPYRLIRFRKIAPKIGMGTPARNVRDNAHQIAILKNGIWQLLDTKLRFKYGYFYDESSDLIYLQSFTDDKVLVFKATQLEQAKTLSEVDAEFVIFLEKGTVQSYLKDRSGVIWIGTGGLGIRKITPRKMAIRTYLRDASVSASLYALDSEAFYVASGKKQYYTEGGAAVIEEIRKASKFSRLQKLHWLHRGDSTWIIADQTFPSRDRRTLTIYTYEQGAVSKQKVIKVDFPEGDPMIHAINTLDKRLAIVTSRRLVFYDPTTKSHQIEAIDILPKSRLLCSQLAQTANGDFWLGSSQGLIHIQPNGDGYDYQLMSSEKNGLLNSNCSSLLIDPKDDNILWIGTVGGGLHRLDTRTMQFEYLNTRNGLPNDVIYGILNDEEGNLWMSSNKGIIRYTPETGVIRNFTAADGMQSNEFNTYAFGKSLNGELLFGGIAGLNIFHPNDLKDNPVVPKLSITGLEVNNQAVSVFDSTGILEKAIEFTSSITLPFEQNNINLRFAALEFSAPQKNQFSYYLEGAEKAWTHTTTDNQAAYLNLSPGKYTFKIKAANGDQVWSEEIRTLDITKLPPWYRTTLAYLVYLLLFGATIWAFIRFQRRRLQLQHKLDLEQKEAERLKELDAFRSRLYTNITHEFRTPLTVILGTSQQLENQVLAKHAAQKKASLIRRNGTNLLNLVNQMLDLSKIDYNELTVNYEQGDLLAYLRYIAESFFSLANSNNILLKVESSQAEIWMDYDAEKMRQILSNLLSNAIKFTPSGGKVILRAVQENEQIQISVKDSGKGISKADLPYVFDRYYQVKSGSEKAGGSGIGLALTKELVQLLGGNIQVKSLVNQGTTFTFYLPIRREAPLQQAIPTIPKMTVSTVAASYQPKLRSDSLPKLLIVEDNRDVVEYLTTCLEQDYHLEFAYNGQAGIECALELMPELIISDVMMPEKTGFELTDTLKNDERTSHIPIVLLTAKADVQSRISGLRQGADAYLPKPFHPEELLVQLNNLLILRQKLQAKYQDLALSTSESTPSTDDQEEIFLQKLRQLLAAELDNADLKADDIAKKIGMSRSNLYAKLTAITGMSFNIYLRTLRLQKSKVLLQNPALTVSEIAYQVGFKNLSYFSNQFRKQFGYAPSEEREG